MEGREEASEKGVGGSSTFHEILIGANRNRRGAKSIGETLIELHGSHKTHNRMEMARTEKYLCAFNAKD